MQQLKFLKAKTVTFFVLGAPSEITDSTFSMEI